MSNLRVETSKDMGNDTKIAIRSECLQKGTDAHPSVSRGHLMFAEASADIAPESTTFHFSSR